MRHITFALLTCAIVPVILSSARQDPSLVPGLRAADAPANAVWIDSLDLSKAATRRPRAPRGQTPAPLVFLLGGVVYPHAVPLVANSDLTIDLGGAATRFKSMVGVDDERRNGQGSVTFDVWVDGKKAAASGVMKSGDAPKLLNVDLTGARQLILASGDGGDGTRDDSADWGGAVIYLGQGGEARPRVVDPPIDPPRPIASSRPSTTTINEPRIVGATPGRPLLFRIPAAGDGPLTFSAENLPPGVTLDARTGIINGSLKAAGKTVVSLTVVGPNGTATSALTIVGGDSALALTPPLGWNSWNVWGGAVDAEKVRAAADAMVSSGLAAQGYQFINIDDAWAGPRDASGAITSNEKFPDMKALADYVHAKGLKIGLYSSPGPRTCEERYAGSYQHEEQDARSYAAWGFDYLKYDWCSYSDVAPNPTLEDRKKPYRVMRSALDKVNRDIVFSLCQYGAGNVWEWGAEVGGNLWRTTGDITDTWPSMSGIGFAQGGHEAYAQPGHWNDPDMLVVGKVGWGPNVHDTRLTPNEQMTHITLWSLQAAPLLIGADMSRIDRFTTDLLGNREVLAVDQDPLGKAAKRVWRDGDVEVWARPLSDGALAVGLFNRGPVAQKVAAKWPDLELSGPRAVRDVWLQKDLGTSAAAFETMVPRHGAVLVKMVTPPTRTPAVQQAGASARERLPFDEGWRFAFGHTSDIDKDFSYSRGQSFAKAGRGTGALSARFDDSAWRALDLPHDWAVELPFQQSADPNLDSHGYKPVGRAFPETTIGWYRKTFDISAVDQGKRLALEFDGIFRDSEVWFNGHQVCRNQGGYIGFCCDITDYVNLGAANLVVVRVDASQVEGWFYEGAGIYRHAWLTKTGPVHVAPHGIFVTTASQGANALVTVKATIENETDAAVDVELVDQVRGMPGARQSTRVSLGPWESTTASQQLTIPNATLWGTETPFLYTL
jgi:alpha-galactosidase